MHVYYKFKSYVVKRTSANKFNLIQLERGEKTRELGPEFFLERKACK